MSDEQKPDELLGKNVGPFTILEQIGRGGMATVYSAMQHSMNRKIAIKVLPHHFLHDPGFLERFEREVEVISQLEHPHILPIYDYGEADGVPFIAMRYLGGGSMAQMVRRGVPTLQDIAKPFQQVAEALDYAHQQGIIHRDLKPGNIMLDESGNAYLSDFGIARVMGSNLTGSAIIGTPAYMSPEQAYGTSIDARSDIYSLGIVLFELITGREPYQAETPMSLLLKHINEPIPSISEFRSNVPIAVQDVVNMATAKNADDRFIAATGLAKAFQAALQGESPKTQVGTETKPDNGRTITQSVRPLANEGGTFMPGETLNKTTPGGRLSAVPQTEVSAQKSSPVMMIAVIIAFIIIAGGAAVYLFAPELVGLGDSGIVLPDGFTAVVAEDYSIGIPSNLLPASADFIDESDENRTLHRWQRDDDLYITVALVRAARMSQDDYFDQYYDDLLPDDDSSDGDESPDAAWIFIDEDTSLDGTLRHSYRIEGFDSMPNGQVDLFFLRRDDFLIVVEMFTSDEHIAANSDAISTLQTILDSIRVDA